MTSFPRMMSSLFVVCRSHGAGGLKLRSQGSGAAIQVVRPGLQAALYHQRLLSQLASCLALAARPSIRSTQAPTPARSIHKSAIRLYSTPDPLNPHVWAQGQGWGQDSLREPDLDWDFLLNPDNTEAIEANIQARKGVGDIHGLLEAAGNWQAEVEEEKKRKLRQRMVSLALDIPNMSHPDTIIGDESCAETVEVVGEKREFDFMPWQAEQVADRGMGMLRLRNLTFSHGDRCYWLEEDLARLERALVNWTLDVLRDRGFEYVAVPDILHDNIIDSCGFRTTLSDNAVYHMAPECLPKSCLAGTSEMALAAFHADEIIDISSLPRKLTSVSQCFRAEADGKAGEKGLYRVHHFTKVEMFALTADENGEESEDMLQSFVELQKELFSRLGLHFRILSMPSQELGAPAARKYDCEAWMYAKQAWGEISSCSNCVDFQTRRLNIQYQRPDGSLRHVHTVNGTACAVPRLIISLLEQGQHKVSKYGRGILLPHELQPYMDGQSELLMKKQPAKYSYITSLRHD